MESKQSEKLEAPIGSFISATKVGEKSWRLIDLYGRVSKASERETELIEAAYNGIDFKTHGGKHETPIPL